MSKTFTVSLFADNHQLVLQRIVIICSRKKLYIESLSVAEVEDKKQALYTLKVRSDREPLEKIVKQLERIVEVHAVSIVDEVFGIKVEQIVQTPEKINGSGEYNKAVVLEQHV